LETRCPALLLCQLIMSPGNLINLTALSGIEILKFLQ
jgi:hypothetical protein